MNNRRYWSLEPQDETTGTRATTDTGATSDRQILEAGAMNDRRW